LTNFKVNPKVNPPNMTSSEDYNFRLSPLLWSEFGKCEKQSAYLFRFEDIIGRSNFSFSKKAIL